MVERGADGFYDYTLIGEADRCLGHFLALFEEIGFLPISKAGL